MKITDIKSYIANETYLVKVETDEGVFGLGQCSHMANDVVLQIINSRLKPYLIGMNPFDTEKIEDIAFKKNRNYKISGQLLAMAYSGIDIALWDLRGKYLNQPVYNLLGGCYRDEIELYGSSMTRNLTIEEECEKIRKAIEKYQFKAVKIKIGPRIGGEIGEFNLWHDVEKVKAIRKTIGEQCRLIVDANSSYTYFQAVQVYEKIKEYDIHIFEEPCPYYDLESYVRLAERVSIPINVGEQDWNFFTFKDFISKGVCQYSAADVTKCGGITNAKRVAALCRAFGVFLTPHNTTINVGMFAAMQLIASSPECKGYHEFNIQPKCPDYVLNPFVPKNGIVQMPKGPGLGIEIDMEMMEKSCQIIG